MAIEDSNRLWLVYDGDCPLCRGMVVGLVRLRLVPPEQVRAFQEYEGEPSQRLWDAGIRNEIAVLDEGSGAIRSGVDGLAWILRPSWLGPIVALSSVSPHFSLARGAYRLVAYNRHLLAPKDPSRIRCACDADFHLGYRLGLIGPALAFATGAAWALLANLRAGAGEHTPLGTALLALCGGWLAAAALAVRMPRERAFDWIGHLALAADLGAFALLPVGVLSVWLEGPVLLALQIGALLLGLIAMAGSLARRVRAMGLSRGWWIAALAPLTAGGLFVVLPLTA